MPHFGSLGVACASMPILGRWDADSEVCTLPTASSSWRYDPSSSERLVETRKKCVLLRSSLPPSEPSGGSESEAEDLPGSESETDSEGGEHGLPNVDLSLMRLEALHASTKCSTPNKLSAYATKGLSKARIRDALAAPRCQCKCQVPDKVLTQVCRGFWRLPKTGQDAILWSIQLESGKASKRTWSIAGSMAYFLQ